MTAGPGRVTVALASSVEQVVTLAVRGGGGRGARAGWLHQDDGLCLGGAAALVTTVVVAGVAGAGVAGGDIAGATDRAPRVGWRPGNQTVHKAGNVMEFVTNGARYRLTQVATIVICCRASTAAVTPTTTTTVTTVVSFVGPSPGQEQEEEERLGCHLTPEQNVTGWSDCWSQ